MTLTQRRRHRDNLSRLACRRTLSSLSLFLSSFSPYFETTILLRLYSLGVQRNAFYCEPLLLFLPRTATSDLPSLSATSDFCRRRAEPTLLTSFSRSSLACILLRARAGDIIALIHFHCVLASKHKSSRPRKSYGTMLTDASSPWPEYRETRLCISCCITKMRSNVSDTILPQLLRGISFTFFPAFE